jgi:GGDEF domain-containing protein
VVKTANDTLGHRVGGRLTAAIAEVVAAVAKGARADATAARIGGDECGLLLPGVTEALAAAMRDLLAAADLAVHAEKTRRCQGRAGDGFQGRRGVVGPVRSSDSCASSAASSPSLS